MPFLERAIAAAESIDPKDIKELGGMKMATDTTRVIMDAIQILFQRSMDQTKEHQFTIMKKQIRFTKDSYDEHTKLTLQNQNFLKDVMEFSNNQKDNINEETIELLQPYLDMKTPDEKEVFSAEVAKIASKALIGLAVWARAMSDYHKASKIVNPKLKFLEVKKAELEEAQDQLSAAEASLEEVNAIKEALNKKFQEANNKKMKLEESAKATKAKMDKANRLIDSLKDNKKRWQQNASEFKSLKQKLVGDVAKACAFVSYCGPFNSEFRDRLMQEFFHTDIVSKGIPVSEELKLTEFLVDEAKIGEWSLQGLPADDLSI